MVQVTGQLLIGKKKYENISNIKNITFLFCQSTLDNKLPKKR